MLKIADCDHLEIFLLIQYSVSSKLAHIWESAHPLLIQFLHSSNFHPHHECWSVLYGLDPYRRRSN